MYALTTVVALAALAQAQSIAQGPAPAPVLLTTTKSGVLPTLPTATPFTGVDTLEGAIIVKGAPNPGYTGLLGDAVPQQNTPGKSFKATLPNTNFNNYTGSTVVGSVTAVVPANGTGVQFTFNISGLPDLAKYGTFGYHIHNAPVPADGNCTSTLGHLDTQNRGEYFPCIATSPQTCQTGDLAGKHGKINGTSYSASYVDLYLSTDPASPYYFGDKSIVFHTTNTTRLTCANFVAVNAAAPNGTTPSAPSSTATPPKATYTGSASSMAISSALLGGAFLIAFLV